MTHKPLTVAALIEALARFDPEAVVTIEGRQIRAYAMEQTNPVRDMDERDPGFAHGGPRMRVRDRDVPPTLNIDLGDEH